MANEPNDNSAEQWVHLNGTLTPKAAAQVSIYDHGFLYGDGAFEGIRVYSGNIFRLEPHLARLYRSVKSLGFALNVDLPTLQAQVVETVRANKHRDGYIRLSVSRGRGGWASIRAVSAPPRPSLSRPNNCACIRRKRTSAGWRPSPPPPAFRPPCVLTRKSNRWAATSTTSPPRPKQIAWAQARP